MTRRRLLVPALSTAAMILVLLGLGSWQVERMAWKCGLLAQIEAAERNSSQPLPSVPLSQDLPPFAKVIATGRPRFDLAARYGAEVRGDVLGAQLIVPLERAGLPVLVDLGWAPNGAAPAAAGSGDTATVTGFIRPGEQPGWFSAAADPPHRLFYTLDPHAIGAALGYAQVAPFVLVALGPQAAPDAAIDPARHLPTLSNNHLQYAITWYSLAVVLLAVFVVYVRKNRA
jgi:surfeit locus 1 family protein